MVAARRVGAVEQTDHELADLMSGYWVNFAAAGDPNGESLPQWPPYATETDEALELGDEVRVVVSFTCRADAGTALRIGRSLEEVL